VLISHNMPEVFEVADRIEVLRLGERVARFRRGDVTMEDVVGAMTGAITHDDVQPPEADGPNQDVGPDAPRR
jgi:simple sugar transport system ATP-binding protein